MFQITDPQTVWVSTTNLVLGLVTLCCAALIASVVINELIERWVARLAYLSDGTGHAFHVSGLGTTMADGGDRVADDRVADDREATGPDYYGF